MNSLGDGRKGRKVYGTELPAEMGLYKVEVKAGRSTQSTLLGRNDITYESLYLSKELIDHLDISPDELLSDSASGEATQLILPIINEIQTYEKLREIARKNRYTIPDYVKKIIAKHLEV